MFSVLEVNIAILCASIPTFWPMISSFATNKILVVNEIVVHVEEYSKTSLDGRPGIGLAEQGAWKSPPESPTPFTNQTSRLGTIARTFDRRLSKDCAPKAKHERTSSAALSIGRTLSRNEITHAAPRSSQDSHCILYNKISPRTSRSASLAKSDDDWFAGQDRDSVRTGTTTKIEKGDNPSDT